MKAPVPYLTLEPMYKEPGIFIHDIDSKLAPEWENLISAKIVDVQGRGTLTLPAASILYPLAGEMWALEAAPSKPVMVNNEQFAQLPGGQHVVYTSNPCRCLLVSSFGPQPVIPVKTWGLFQVPTALHRPAGINLQSLGEATDLNGFGLEYVTVQGTIPNHTHLNSSSLIVVIQGSGYCGITKGTKQFVTSTHEDDVIFIPAGTAHGFQGDMLFISIQFPAIGTDYVLHEWEYNYPTFYR